MQTWRINGQIYTHCQLMELKKQGLDPRKDTIVMAAITKPKVEPEKHTVEITEEVAKEYPELEEQGVKVGDKMEVEGEVSLEELTLAELKTMAKAKGMPTSNKTKKADVLAFLRQ